MNQSTLAPLRWRGDADGELDLLDQTRLPDETRWLACRTPDDVIAAIRALSVRGAPAIGIAAAYGAVLAAQRADDRAPGPFRRDLLAGIDALETSRPTAVNLAAAMARMRRVLATAGDASAADIRHRLFLEAHAIRNEEEAACDAMASFGATLLPDPCAVITHCHTGGLATGGIGTALGVIVRAHERGTRIRAFVDETRPLMQGARLTAVELGRAGVPTTLICDSAAASVLAAGGIDAVLVGADRIAANGDVANKVGTLSLAVLASEFGIPFYVVAPVSTIDRSTPTGAEIPIELRAGSEIVPGHTLPAGVEVHNPAFDVTPAARITAIVTDRGVLEPPLDAAIARVAS